MGLLGAVVCLACVLYFIILCPYFSKFLNTAVGPIHYFLSTILAIPMWLSCHLILSVGLAMMPRMVHYLSVFTKILTFSRCGQSALFSLIGQPTAPICLRLSWYNHQKTHMPGNPSAPGRGGQLHTLLLGFYKKLMSSTAVAHSLAYLSNSRNRR